MREFEKILMILIAFMLTLSFVLSGSIMVSSGSSTVQHVILIMMENHDDAHIVGNSEAHYENSLISHYAFAKDYFALSTGGLKDYIGITDGSTSIAHETAECLPTSCYTSDTNLFWLMQKHGLSWMGYAESMPSSCYEKNYGSLPNEYLPRHTAIPYYTDLAKYCSAHDVPLTDFSVSNLPNFAMISPNVCNDMHSCSISTGDKWLSGFVNKIISSSAFSSTIILITFDNGPAVSDPIPMIIVGPSNLVHYGTFSQKYNHYSTLATIEDIFKLGNLGRRDASATPMSAIIPSA